MSEKSINALDAVFTDLEAAIDNNDMQKASELCGKVLSALDSINVMCKNGKK